MLSKVEHRDFDVMEGVTTDYYDKSDTDLSARWRALTGWFDARLGARLDPYCKYTASRIDSEITAFTRDGEPLSGVNFASQDYLNLATEKRVINAATEAAERYGVHSAGSSALMGLTEVTIELERKLAAFLGVADTTVFPTGWGAGYGLVRTLVRREDYVVIDVLAHACLQEGAEAATPNVHRFPHCSNEAVERRLSRLRTNEARAGILVVTETVFSMDSDVPNLAELRSICSRYGATLVVDVAHDLGAIGAGGRGYLEIQGALSNVDIIMGSFSKTFASNGGFVASNRTELKLALRSSCGPLTFTNAMSPMQAAAVLACLAIVDSPEGERRRRRLMENIDYMRGRLQTAGFNVLGAPSAIVPVVLGRNGLSRMMTSYMLGNGAIVNLVEYPAVAKNGCRWRVQMMHNHTKGQIDSFVETAVAAREAISCQGDNLVDVDEAI
ncbi:aminotransferase class I/II-fold pyridoxal phosphate-dependent enzyme [Mesorhizobium sp. VK23B]|uniref:Aminotransferase class I/II-fold pyridoxal phosphate-dependent enzyme n=1 Tax=Mesorhizobium dulcispinae TaxID=3072316 RepID=A0ABU4X850_9HYPH|nr:MULTISPECIES: aminotransferase class I/II-fold pyridoxal phosphate-dependent enzyme [unclassified Mesorhizobium]MDX8464600.1 aminotransferase class I/II-fold pyridoxal phosphate-dependent enzyme [Mesorhizobium sp. VK23B]MDX8470986.1 aminotransferase class I/II-fold pyridoxal phosphate-dependent enzyme [Mesorhizobium sp. VK23A]